MPSLIHLSFSWHFRTPPRSLHIHAPHIFTILQRPFYHSILLTLAHLALPHTSDTLFPLPCTPYGNPHLSVLPALLHTSRHCSELLSTINPHPNFATSTPWVGRSGSKANILSSIFKNASFNNLDSNSQMDSEAGRWLW